MADFSFQNKTVVLMIKVAMLGGAERQALGLADFLIKNYFFSFFLYREYTNGFLGSQILLARKLIFYSLNSYTFSEKQGKPCVANSSLLIPIGLISPL